MAFKIHLPLAMRQRFLRPEAATPGQKPAFVHCAPRSVRLIVASLAVVAISACMLPNIGTEEKLRDALTLFNDDLRWMRLRAASEFVSPAYQQRFAKLHTGWGEGKQIADTEIIAVHFDTTKDTARARVAFVWYERGHMTIRKSEVEQNWKKRGRSFILTGTKVASGDRSLLTNKR